MNAMSKKTALVIGGTGYIGSNIVQSLLSGGYAVRVLARNRQRALSLLPAACEVVVGDLTRPETLAAAIVDVGLVFFAAGIPERPATQRDFVTGNVVAVENLFASLPQSRPPRVVLTSSVVVDPRCDAELLCSPYVESKRAAEAVALESMRASAAADVVILRPSVVYGPGVGFRSLIINRIIDWYARLPIPVSLPGSIPMVLSTDLGKAHVVAAEQASAGAIIHLNEGAHSLALVAAAAASVSGKARPDWFTLPAPLAAFSARGNDLLGRWLGLPVLLSSCQQRMTRPGALPSVEGGFEQLQLAATGLTQGVAATIAAYAD